MVALQAAEVKDNRGKGKESPLKKPNVIGDIKRMNINKVDLGLENNGNTGLDGESYYPNGTTLTFLFAGGLACSGYINGELRTAWMAAASRIKEFQPGKWGQNPDDPKAKFYVVDKDDDFGSAAYVEWADAVALGADFQDLNGDGVYDPNVDRPDMLGDRIIWCVYNDGTDANFRARLNTKPMGIEVHQMAWAFNREDALGDVVFIRYRVINPTDQDIDDFIFTAWVDPDLGDYRDDLIGCDTTLSLGFIYNDGEDDMYGANPPAFGIDFFQGPIVDSPGDTAYRYRGPFFGIDTLIDKKNLPMTSFMYYIQSHPTLGDPNTAQEARYYQEGGVDREGNPIDPVNFGFGVGASESDNPRYLFSGDPVTGTGWLDSPPSDKRFMVNSGPFQLAAGDTQDIVIAYIVSQGTDAINSVAKLKEVDQLAQAAYNGNFFVAGPPPAPKYYVRNLDQKIELVIDLRDWLAYDVTDKLLNRQKFEGFTIYQFASPNVTDFVSGVENAKVIGRFDIKNEYGDIYVDTKEGRIRIWEGQDNLDLEDYKDENSQFFRFVIETDKFNNDQPLINGVRYYFAIVPFSIEVNNIKPNELTPKVENDWVVIPAGGFLELSRQSGFFSVVPGSSELTPYYSTDSRSDDGFVRHVQGKSEGFVAVDVVDPGQVTGQDYQISFFGDGNYWRITRGATVVLDSVSVQGIEGTEWNFPVVDGLAVRVFTKEDKVARVDSSGTFWLSGRGDLSTLSDKAEFNRGIDYAKYFSKLRGISNIKRHQYFPVKVVFDTTNSAKAYVWRDDRFRRFRGLFDTFIRAYDVSNPDQPRQLNVIYNSPTGRITASSLKKTFIFVTTSTYDTTGIYPDTTGKFQDAYLVLNLDIAAKNDTAVYEFQEGVLELMVYPTYVNSDEDVFEFSTAKFAQGLSLDERKEMLNRIKVVPNPYFAYSAYERSYDRPVIKFIHLDREATIRIFNLAGQLVKTLYKNNSSNEITWDLMNEAGLKVASGMYIAHIEIPGVGTKVLKFGIIQREERIDRY